MRIRIVPLKSGKHTIQAVSKKLGKLTVHKHLGTFANDAEKQELLEKAREYIKSQTGQEDLFAPPEHLQLKNVIITQSQPLFLYRLLCRIYSHLGFDRCSAALINFAKTGLNDSLRLVFYDVTTLAFDSQLRAGLKDFGFSKDHRFTDVQIIVGLVVNADGAMISRINIEELDKRNIGFIVGARLANMPVKLQEQISRDILSQDLKTTTVNYLNHRLICQYRSQRAAKDRSDREKQITKAEIVISFPSQIARRFRFVKTVNGRYAVNKVLVEKAKRLEGIKGYLTNTSLDETIVIDRYHDLWKIEKAFRLTKTDLEARPVFLRLDETITCHLIVVFAALAICRFLEIKTNMSIQKILKIAQKVLTHQAFNSQTGEKALIETTILKEELKQKTDLLHSMGH